MGETDSEGNKVLDDVRASARRDAEARLIAERVRHMVACEKIYAQIRQTGGYIPIKEEDDELTIMSKAFMIAQKTIDSQHYITPFKMIYYQGLTIPRVVLIVLLGWTQL